MYDDNDVVYRGPRTGSVFLLSLFVSALTSAGVFFALRELVPDKPDAKPAVPVEVPSITGMPVAQARELLDGRGLLLVLDAEREDPKVPAGALVGQAPLVGSKVRPGSEVHATLSTGMSKLKVPDVSGMPADRAQQALDKLKLVVAGQDPEASAEVAAGTVLGTKPPAGTEVSSGTEVRLRVSSGAGTVEVPKLVGMSSRKAKEAIEAAKLKVGSTRTTYDEERSPYVVLKQDPAPGTKVAPGTPINLVLNEGD